MLVQVTGSYRHPELDRLRVSITGLDAILNVTA